jgi:glycosyltransferase involved in cell wall biosynthesis
MNSHPAISVIVPCYGQARFLPECIESVRKQTFTDWECVVVNDGSPDDTGAVARRLAAEDSRVRLVEQENRGLAGARNRGIEEARGKWIQFLDADDMIELEKFRLQVRALEGISELAVAYCDSLRVVNRQGKREISPIETLRLDPEEPVIDIAMRWSLEGAIPVHAFLFDARIFKDRGIRFDESLRNVEDWECWMRLFRLRPRLVFVDAPLALYRVHDASMCWDRESMRRGTLLAIEKQMQLADGDERMKRILEERLAAIFSAERAREFGERVARERGIPRRELLASNPLAWRAMRWAGVARGGLIYASSVMAGGAEQRMQRRWLAFETIGYNREALRLAREKDRRLAEE